jgi:hypothetical protein
MGTLTRDIRYGIHQLSKERGSSMVAVLTLALGIGVSTALFSVIDATLLRPLPYPQPEQLVTIGVELVQDDGRTSRPTVSMEDVRAWQAATDVFSAVAGTGSAFRGRIADGIEPARLQVAHYTEDYLPMHGVTPILGRGFVRGDTGRAARGAPRLRLLAEPLLWTGRRHRRPSWRAAGVGRRGRRSSQTPWKTVQQPWCGSCLTAASCPGKGRFESGTRHRGNAWSHARCAVEARGLGIASWVPASCWHRWP